MAHTLMMMSDYYGSCCNCWKQDEQWDAKKPLNHSALNRTSNEVAGRIANYSSIKSWPTQGTAGRGQRESRQKDWRFCHLDCSSEYICAYRSLFSSVLTDCTMTASNNCTARTLKRISMRPNRSKRRIPLSSQLHDSIMIIGMSRKSQLASTVDLVGRYLAHRMGTWQPHCVDDSDQAEGHAEQPARSPETVSICSGNAGDSAAHCGRLLAGKLRPVSIVDSRLYVANHPIATKHLTCATSEQLKPQRNEGPDTDITSESRLLKPAVGQLVHFRGSIAARVSDAQLLTPTPLHTSTLPIATCILASNRDEASSYSELDTLFRREQDPKSDDKTQRQLTQCRNGKSTSNNRPSHDVRKPFKAVCPSRSLQCFLRSKQRRCLHYRKAVLGEGAVTLPYDVSKKWSCDSSLVRPN